MLKYYDLPRTTTTLSSTAVFVPINVMVKGVDFFNRVTNRVYMAEVEIISIIRPTGANVNYDLARVMIVWDRSPNGALPTIGDILQDAHLASTTAYSFANFSNMNRFIILMDKKLFIPLINNAAVLAVYAPTPDTCGQSLRIEETIKICLPATYNNTNGGTILDLNSGSLLYVTFSDVTLANSGWQVASGIRLKYYDA